jgi:hypothetical protein
MSWLANQGRLVVSASTPAMPIASMGRANPCPRRTSTISHAMTSAWSAMFGQNESGAPARRNAPYSAERPISSVPSSGRSR